MKSRLSAAAVATGILVAAASPASPARADKHRNDQWYLKSLGITQAHQISTGTGITVGVVDTGVDPHPDLRKNLLAGTSTAPGVTGNGKSDLDGHGTMMAALVAAHGHGSQDGVLGIAPGAKILPVKFVHKETNAPADPMAMGIEWAADQDVEVINVSSATGPAFKLLSEVKTAIKKDIVVVSGSGNTSEMLLTAYPSAIDGVLVAGGTDRRGRHASLSVKNPRVQICAPSVEIKTAGPKNKYFTIDGTSASSAIVSGAVALVRSKFPDLSGPEVIHRLTATADDIGPPGRDDECGFGLLNIVKALTADVPPLGDAAAPSATDSPATAAPAGATTAAAAPADAAAPVGKTEPASNSTPLIAGGLLIGLAVVGGLAAVYVLRRRRGA